MLYYVTGTVQFMSKNEIIRIIIKFLKYVIFVNYDNCFENTVVCMY